jgi:PTH1 family peptidyl-tRNA hydrolase
VKSEESQAVKLEHCVVNHVMSELDVTCLPADLPEFIEVDLSGLKKGFSLHLNDVKLPKGVTAVTHGKENPVLVSVVATGGRRGRTGRCAACRCQGRPQGGSPRPKPRLLPRPPRPCRPNRLPRSKSLPAPVLRSTNGPPGGPFFQDLIIPMIKLFVGLGNPGTEYEATRHNAGFWWIDALARELKVPCAPDKGYHGLVARTTVQGQTRLAAGAADLHEPVGQVGGGAGALLQDPARRNPGGARRTGHGARPGQAQAGGSHAGHNGLRDIHAQLGTGDYWRLRLGIGHPGVKSEVINWVLKKPAPSSAPPSKNA